jgi:type I restriction enzyme S subunit
MAESKEGWSYKPVTELINSDVDYRGKTPPKAESGIPCISAANVKNGTVQIGDKYVSEEVYKGWTTRGLIKAGDVLITTEAPVAEVAQVPTDRTYLITRRVIALQVNPETANPTFLKYALLSPRNKERLEILAHGATVPRLYKEDILEFKIWCPPLAVQRQIAGVLSAYDDLIENNARRIALLEELAQLLYREWFVRFRFPGHEALERVEALPQEGSVSPVTGPIPAGWKIEPLKEVCRLILGVSPKSKYYNEYGEGLPFHQGVSDFGEIYPVTRRYCTQRKRVAQEDDILFSVRAPVGRINLADRTIVIGRGLHAIRSKSGHQFFILLQLLEKFAEEDQVGSGTIFKSVTKKDMQGIQFLIPPADLRDRFEDIVTPMYAEIKNLTKKNALLRTTRDLLLPRLVSGEVDVSEVAL